MQREDVLGQALQLLEIYGIASTTLEMVADRIDYPLDDLKRFWPDKEALVYDALRYLSQQVDIWRRQLMLNEELTATKAAGALYRPDGMCQQQPLSGLPVYCGLYVLSRSRPSCPSVGGSAKTGCA